MGITGGYGRVLATLGQPPGAAAPGSHVTASAWFFFTRDVLEVDVPALGLTGVTDVHIDCPRLEGPNPAYLQSSPEFYMKRLLAAGAGSIFYLGKAYRSGELGPRHYPEFTLLEWYRNGWDEHQLMAEVAALLVEVGVLPAGKTPANTAYRGIFEQATGMDPVSVDLGRLRRYATKIAARDFSAEERSTCLDLIFSQVVEPSLPRGVVFVRDYPACQAALAQTGEDERGEEVARRFEVFIDGMELANGYFELCDVEELRRRFMADNEKRRLSGRAQIPMDERLLEAMAAGLPACAGVAMGIDRLLMKAVGAADIREVLPFADFA